MAELTWLDRLEATRPYQRVRLRMNRGLVTFFHRHVFSGKANLRVAELACGSGFASHLIANEPEVALSVAADINLEDYRQANIKSFRASFVLMDLFRLGFQPGSIDLVWNSSSIEELDRPEEALHAMAWLTKPGGWVFVGVPSSHGPARWLRVIPSKRTKAWLGRVYSRQQLRDLLRTAGLRVEKETTYLYGTFIGALGRKPF